MKPVKKNFFFINLLLTILVMMANCSGSKKIINSPAQGRDSLLATLLHQQPLLFDAVLKKKEEWNVQVIYTQIDRRKNGRVVFTDHFFNVDNKKYFYPASTVKFPIAVLALQKLNELKMAGLDMNTTMITGADGNFQTNVYNDPTTKDGRPTIANYIKKILLVSDNDAFNRLYEFLGQEYINKTLHKLGYEHGQILHRLQISLTEEQNRHTNPIKFIDKNSNVIYEQPAVASKWPYAKRNTRMGKGYMEGDKLIKEPFDFSSKNRLNLADLHAILKAVIFPEENVKENRFNLTTDDYKFLYRYMSMYPRESAHPQYDSVAYWDTYVKFLLYGSEPVKNEPHIRIFNKAGDAYGFLIDAAYIVDYKNNIEFILSAIIHCNSDGIFNDDKYDYDTIGFPFFKNLGRVIYEHELKRERKVVPDLSSFTLDYKSAK
ncbi:MAG: serine hydrolase [Chitinophagaceae bacterium]